MPSESASPATARRTLGIQSGSPCPSTTTSRVEFRVARLRAELEPDAVAIEAIWTTLLSYARCFGAAGSGGSEGSGGVLTEDDVATAHSNTEEVLEWHPACC